MKFPIQAILFIFLTIMSITSCSQKRIPESFLSVDFMDFLSNTRQVEIYIVDRDRYYFDGDVDYEIPPLITEDEIRREGNKIVLYSHNSDQASFITALLYSAKQVNIDDKKNVVYSIEREGILMHRKGGIVIDIIQRGGEDRTFIMQDGLNVFYEKGKEGIYYEMPKIILENYFISEKEFIKYIKNKKLQIDRTAKRVVSTN